MLSLGIPVDFDDRGTIVDLDIGGEIIAKDFPQDSEYQLLAFPPSRNAAEVVWVEELTKDIAEAVAYLDQGALKKGKKPDWYRRLALYSSGVKRRAARA